MAEITSAIIFSFLTNFYYIIMKEVLYDLINSYKHCRSAMTYVCSKIKNNKELYKDIINKTNQKKLSSNKLTEKIYCIINEVEAPSCKVCHSVLAKFKSFSVGYSDFCSRKCAVASPEYKQLMSIINSRPNKNKGKSYKEIYNEKIPTCGFQPGDNNVARRPEIREKISIGVKKSYTPELRQKRRNQVYKDFDSGKSFCRYQKKYKNSKGEMFRSSLEVHFSEFLIRNSFHYEYEKVFKLINGKRKIVDFVIDNLILVEISGYAYKKWQEDFKTKMFLLRESINNPILILTYSDKTEQIFKDFIFAGMDIFFGNIYDEERIIKSINFFKKIWESNELFLLKFRSI
jgi:hypothetical protein